MTKTRAFAWIVSAAAFGAMLVASPAMAQGYYQGRDGYVQRIEPFGMPQRGYEVPPPVHSRTRPIDPYYGNQPSPRDYRPVPQVHKYGSGPKRHWRRWTRDRHPGWQPDYGVRRDYGWRGTDDGWARPRGYEYR